MTSSSLPAQPLSRSSRARALALPVLAVATALALSACGARTAAGDTGTAGSTGAASCVDTSGDTVKIGFLNSLSGT
ncbi:MAG: hypothetical protein J7503_16235, partial [Cellulomonas iranensis]|nr:hypothetical protein [Cellulomonas iranensis]